MSQNDKINNVRFPVLLHVSSKYHKVLAEQYGI